MSTIASRRILWAGLLLTLPVPMWFIGPGRLPTLALYQISSYMAAVFAVEGGQGSWLAVWTIGLQGVFWTLVLYGVARVGTSLLARIAPGRAVAPAVGALVVALLILSMFDVYQAAIVSRGEPVNIFGAY